MFIVLYKIFEMISALAFTRLQVWYYARLVVVSVRRNRRCFLSSEGEVHARCIARSSSLELHG